jgi:hypothetical protein
MPPDGPLPGPWHHPIHAVETSSPRASPEPRTLDSVKCPVKYTEKCPVKYMGWQASGWTFQFNVFLSIFLTKVRKSSIGINKVSKPVNFFFFLWLKFSRSCCF